MGTRKFTETEGHSLQIPHRTTNPVEICFHAFLATVQCIYCGRVSGLKKGEQPKTCRQLEWHHLVKHTANQMWKNYLVLNC